MRRRIAIAVAMLLAIGAGIASASLVTAGTAAEQPPGGRDELPSGSVQTGDPVADTQGGPPWAVRIFDGDTSVRCVVAGRTDGEAFGPVDSAGEIHDRGDVASGSCADPAQDPVQAAAMRFADTAGTGPRTVVYGVAAPGVASVKVTASGVTRTVTLDSMRTFLVVSNVLEAGGETTVEAALDDGTTRTYHL